MNLLLEVDEFEYCLRSRVYTASQPEFAFVTPSERRLRDDLKKAQERAENWADAFKEATQAMLIQRDEMNPQADIYAAASSGAQKEREELRKTARELADLLAQNFGSTVDNLASSSSTPRKPRNPTVATLQRHGVAQGSRSSEVQRDRVLSTRTTTNSDATNHQVLNSTPIAANFRSTQISQMNLDSTTQNDFSRADNSEVLSLNVSDTLVNDLNATLLQVNSTLKSANSGKISVKRDYKLTQKSDNDLWMVSLKSELQTLDLLDVIDSDVPPIRLFTASEIQKRKFCDRFDDLIREHEMKPIEESDKKAIFYQAVSDNSHDVRISEVIINALNKDMTPNEMKNLMLQLEASNTSQRSNSEVRANAAQMKERCRRCARQGHLWAACPLTAQGLWYCYYCKDNVPHNVNDPRCPSRNNPRDGYVPNNNRNNSANLPNRGIFQKNRGSLRGRGSGGGISGGRGGRVGKKTVPPIPTPGRNERQGQEKGRLRLAENYF
ncbi:hypothetical protein QAD02_021661 [Eretmocerus hayati]|uniref:Uncharacterized protein n=1 Tax=Eretmocerus hayati TaxID=131215 RepID=A0ACC2PQV8_9HYME|nr:hypothetical protein QAD02_021661 [Eretmocerus hayati]